MDPRQAVVGQFLVNQALSHMAEDYYATLGVSRSASAEEIHKAYRNLARRYHPDLNPDDDDAKKKFQEIQHAYETLKDPKKRELFDRYGSAYESMGGGAAGGGPWRPRPGGAGGPGFGGFQDVDLSDLFGGEGGGGGGFSDLFRQFTRRPSGKRGGNVPPRPNHIEHELQVPLRTAVSGGTAQITVRRSSGKVETINVKIPAGIDDGKKIRLKGQGEPGPQGEVGDILITVRVAAHPCYQRQGNDLIVKVPITLAEALLGAKIDIPTPKGTITLTLPAGTSGGKRLRVKGHGVQQSDKSGDLYAELNIVLPEDLNDAARETLAKLATGPENPRAQVIW